MSRTFIRHGDLNPGLNDSKPAGQVHCLLCGPFDAISGWDLFLLDLKVHCWVPCATGCLAPVLRLTASLRLENGNGARWNAFLGGEVRGIGSINVSGSKYLVIKGSVFTVGNGVKAGSKKEHSP